MYACLVEFGGHNLNGFTPNSTGQIRCKSIEIDAGRFGCKSIKITLPVKGFGGHNLNGFTPNLTGRTQPGINYWLNWVEIH